MQTARQSLTLDSWAKSPPEKTPKGLNHMFHIYNFSNPELVNYSLEHFGQDHEFLTLEELHDLYFELGLDIESIEYFINWSSSNFKNYFWEKLEQEEAEYRGLGFEEYKEKVFEEWVNLPETQDFLKLQKELEGMAEEVYSVIKAVEEDNKESA
jgi:hypothetical protein